MAHGELRDGEAFGLRHDDGAAEVDIEEVEVGPRRLVALRPRVRCRPALHRRSTPRTRSRRRSVDV